MTQLSGPEKARFIGEMFGRIAPRYDLLNTVMTGGMHHRWRDLTAKLATHEHNRFDVERPALDIGTGTGDLALNLVHRLGPRRVVALDFAIPMLRMALAKTKSRGFEQPVAFLAADALVLPFGSDTFLCVTCGFTLRNVIDVRQALAEMTRVVRPGGRVVILEITPVRSTNPFATLFRFYFRNIVPLLGKYIAGDHRAYSYLPESVEGFMDANVLAKLMEEVGLHQVHYQLMGFGSVAIHVGQKAMI